MRLPRSCMDWATGLCNLCEAVTRDETRTADDAEAEEREKPLEDGPLGCVAHRGEPDGEMPSKDAVERIIDLDILSEFSEHIDAAIEQCVAHGGTRRRVGEAIST